MDKISELEQRMENLEGEIDRLKAFSDYLAVTEDYKMDHYSDEGGWEKLDIDAFEIAKHLREHIEQLAAKYNELKSSLKS